MSRCRACGRRLLRPSPTGLGPVCARRLAARGQPPVVRAADPAPEIHPDQTALPLVTHQPSLWSL